MRLKKCIKPDDKVLSKAEMIRAGRRCAITGITTSGLPSLLFIAPAYPLLHTVLHSLVQTLGTGTNAFGTDNVLVPSVCNTITERSGGSNVGRM